MKHISCYFLSNSYPIFILLLFLNFQLSPSLSSGNVRIPVIDILPIMDSGNPSYHSTAIAIHKSFQKYGLFIGLGQFLNSAAYTREILSSKRLFALPLQEKLAAKMNDSESFGRGYIAFGEEAGLSDFFESKEGYSYGYPLVGENDMKSNLLTSANKWPSTFHPSDIDQLNSLFLSKSLIAERVLEAAFSIFDNSTSSQSFAQEGRTISLMRLFHYSPTDNQIGTIETDSQSSSDDSRERIKVRRILGSSPHTDWGLLTVITDNNVAGLQFLYNNTWVDVILPEVEAAQDDAPAVFVVNAGDYLELLTNHYYHSPVHRVLLPTIAEGDRYSAVFFYYPNYDSPLNLFHRLPQDETASDADSIPEICSPEEEAKVKFNTLLKLSSTGNASNSNITFGDYIMKKWKGVSGKEN